jgi:hypothetical protein
MADGIASTSAQRTGSRRRNTRIKHCCDSLLRRCRVRLRPFGPPRTFFPIGILTVAILLTTASIGRAHDDADTKAEPNSEQAAEIDTEHIFGFADGTDIGEKGEREIENIAVGSFGRIGSYNQIDNETSFRYVITDHLRLSIGTLSDYYNIHDVPGLTNRSSTNFSGLIAEIRWNIVDRSKNSFGMTLSFNPQWRMLDPDSGDKSENYSLPVSLLVDKEIIPEKFFTTVNFVYAPSSLRVSGGWEHEDAFTLIAAGAYAIAPNTFFGAEIRHENLAVNGNLDAHALFVGPSLFYSLSKDLSVKVAWAAQIPDIGATTLDLRTYERHQFELLIVYGF